MLQASDEQMRRICRVFPSTLLRQPLHVALVISSLASHLQMPPVSVHLAAAVICPDKWFWQLDAGTPLMQEMLLTCRTVGTCTH
jgi:hypothetical protein